MTVWQILAVDWFVDRKIKKAAQEMQAKKEPPVQPQTTSRVDVDFAHSTPRGRKIGAFFLVVFIIIAIACYLTSHFFYALLFLFAAVCALLWPYMEQIENEKP